MGAERRDEPHEAETPLVQMPGINGNPVGPSFREGQRRAPDTHPVRSLLIGLVPVVLLVGFLFLTGQL